MKVPLVALALITCASHAEIQVGVIAPSKNAENLNARFYVPPRLRSDIKENSKALIQIVGWPMLVLPGAVSYVAPKNDAASGLMQIRIEVQKANAQIAPGTQVFAVIGN